MNPKTSRRIDQFVIVAGTLGAITIFAQKKRIKDLEQVIRTQETALEVTRRSLFRASTMMSLPQFLGLVDDTVNDIKFTHIVKNI